MANLYNMIYNFNALDECSRQKSSIHSLNPITKVMVYFGFILMIISYNRYEVIHLLPYILFPVMMMEWSGIAYGIILKRLLVSLPFFMGIGFLNPLFDRQMIDILNFQIAQGWVVAAGFVLKGMLTISAATLMIATTGILEIAQVMRKIKIPKLFVLQLLLTYRYIEILLNETLRMIRAYHLRAPHQNGINHKTWGPFAGQLFLRTYDKGHRIYQAMVTRGFDGAFRGYDPHKMGCKDYAFILFWTSYFICCRVFNVPLMMGALLGGIF